MSSLWGTVSTGGKVASASMGGSDGRVGGSDGRAEGGGCQGGRVPPGGCRDNLPLGAGWRPLYIGHY